MRIEERKTPSPVREMASEERVEISRKAKRNQRRRERRKIKRAQEEEEANAAVDVPSSPSPTPVPNPKRQLPPSLRTARGDSPHPKRVHIGKTQRKVYDSSKPVVELKGAKDTAGFSKRQQKRWREDQWKQTRKGNPGNKGKSKGKGASKGKSKKGQKTKS